MQVSYYKRYRMEIELAGKEFTCRLPPGYRLLGWDESLLDAFALAKYRSFCHEIDAHVFPCLGDLSGCRRLMLEITRKKGFLPAATWLLVCDRHTRQPDYCGTIQGIIDSEGLGAVQNLGVAPEHRNCGLGTALLFRALEGFARSGVLRVHLEVTAQNEGAIRLYRRLGFATVKTLFKSAEVLQR
jgi:GNAT superfamily N-acetyltransferase